MKSFLINSIIIVGIDGYVRVGSTFSEYLKSFF
jgi:hypothetical protein